MKVDLLIENGTIVTSSGRKKAAIGVKNGRIAAVTTTTEGIEARETLDASGLHILPGIVDTEAHPGCYNPFKDDVATETRAAASVGVTTWGVHQPSTRLGAEPFVEYVQAEDVGPFLPVMPGCIEIIKNHSAVDMYITPMIETDEQVAEIPQMASEFGVTSYKLYCQSMKPELDKYWAGRKAGLGHGFDDGVIFGVMQKVAALGGAAITQIHAENWQIARLIEKDLIDAGRTDFAAWTDRSPHFCEVHHVRSYGYLAKITGSPLFIQHSSTRQTHEEILRIQGEGVTIYGNTGPAWLYLQPNQEAWRINVPIRYPEDQEAIWKALAEGKGVDSVSSDHVISWPPNAKEDMFNENIWKLRTGFTSRVEMLVPVVLSEGVNGGRLSLERAVEVLCESPAKIFGIYPKKGAIEVGADADFCFVDMEKKVTVTKENTVSGSGWNIVDGHTFTGWPVRTILRGRTISEWKDGDPGPTVVTQGETHGEYLPRVNGHKLYTVD